MLTQCSPTEMEFGRAGGRRVVADFDGGLVSSDAGALLLGETDKAIGLIDRFTACFGDHRSPLFIVHALKALIAQRVFGLALGYEDLNDHDDFAAIRFWACCWASSSAMAMSRRRWRARAR